MRMTCRQERRLRVYAKIKSGITEGTMVNLVQEFAADHREMTKLQLALDNSDDAHAVEPSDELDQLRGPHIQFE